MPRKPVLPLVLVLALAVLFLGTGSSAVVAEAQGAQGKARIAKLGQAKKLGRGNSCRRQLAARSSRLSARQRQRRARRAARSCHRVATQSSGAPSTLFWGGWIGSQLTGDEAPWDMNAVAEFEGIANKGMSVVNFSSPFANCSSSKCSYYDFPTQPMESIRSHGSIPFFSWGSQALGAGLNQPDFQLADVIAGTHDAYIRQFAEEARDWGHPFFLRFNWEMNGNWFAWMEGVNGNQPGESAAAWRHVHDIFTSVGATNATWVWCPNVDPENNLRDLASLYPGDEYVDWTGLDGYNWGTNPARPDKWRTFDQLYRSTYTEITETIAPSKPLIISEVGSTEHGGSKAAWIREMLAAVPVHYPKIRGLLWFEKYDDGMDWPIETSSSAAGAFAEGIQATSYRTNAYGSLGAGPIAPPS